MRRAYELCANSYLVKPVNIQTLVEMLKTIDAYWISLNQNLHYSPSPHAT
jgi:YesN/AraC family two-component response regulator